jgi:hypothetical protein
VDCTDSVLRRELMSETVTIKYILKFTDQEFTVDLEFLQKDFSLINIYPSKKEWTRLEHHKCSHCPLSEKQSLFCPLASAIDNIISKLQDFLSYDEVHVQVEYKNRIISADITVQRALSSLLGLIIPASGCPHTVYFRPMLRFHLPFSDTEETIYRATSMFLLAQYFIFKKTNCIPTDFSRLEAIYNNVHTVNTYICRRLREVSEEDCYLNAIVILDMYSLSIHSALEHGLETLESYFSAYRENFVPPFANTD